ncbi:MAG: PAS domain S-box protein [Candidatus Marinimicrobia bacterium]|nr:PAS domain S-box protein [Candidatus Neomarinimicrobiota bacterium]
MSKSLKALIVEDDLITAEDISRILKEAGYRVLGIASSYKSAMEIAKINRPDIALLDIHIKEKFDGVEIADKIRQNFDIPIIYITGYCDKETIERAKRSNPVGFVLKPFREVELLSIMEMGLHKYRLERELKEREKRYRKLVEDINDIVFSIEPGGKISYISPNIEAISGFRPGEIVGRNFVEFIEPEDVENVIKEFRSKVLMGLPGEVECRMKNKKGEIRWTRVSVKPEMQDGNLVASRGILYDITERKNAEAKIKRINKILRLISDASGVFLKSRSWDENILDILKMIEEALDVSRVYIYQFFYKQGRLFTRVIHEWAKKGITLQKDYPELLDFDMEKYGFMDEIEKFKRGKTVYGFVEDFPEAERRVFESHNVKSLCNVPIFVRGELWGFFGFDQCERKEIVWSEEEVNLLSSFAEIIGLAIERDLYHLELAETNKRFEDFARTSRDVFYIYQVKPQPKVLFINKAAEDISGIPLKEFYDNPDVWERIIYKDDLGILVKIHEEKSKSSQKYQARWVDRKGSIRWMEHVNFPIFDKDGSINVVQGVARDVTERKKYEERLKQEMEKARAFFETAGCIMLILDKDANIYDINVNGCKILGYKKEQIKGKNWFDIAIPEDHREEIEKVFKVIREELLSKTYVSPIITRKGTKKEILWNNSVLTDEKGNFEFIISSGIDISGILFAERRFKEMVDLLPVVVVETDKNGRITFVNKISTVMFGYDLDDLKKGLNVFEFVSEPDADVVKRDYKKVLRGGKVCSFEYVLKRKDGSVFPALIYATSIKRDDTVVGIRCVITDITTLKEYENQIKWIHDIYRKAIMNVGAIPYLLKYPSKTYEFFGENYKKILGFELKEMKADEFGKRVSSVRVMDENLPSDYRRLIDAFESGEVDRFKVDYEIIDDVGKRRWIHDSSIPIKDEKTGEVVKSLGILLDITERKKIEQRLVESEAQLKSILSSIVDLVFAIDKDGKFSFAHVGDKNLLYHIGSIIGQNYSEILPHSLVEKIDVAIKKNRVGEVESFNFELEVPEGKRWFSAKMSPMIVNGKYLGSVVVARDVTETQNMIAELKRSEENFRNIVENSYDGIIVWQNDRCVLVNKAVENISNYSIDELLGNTINYGNMLPKEEFRKLSELQDRISKGLVNFPIKLELRAYSKDKRFLYLDITVSRFNWNGKPAFLIIIRDMTEFNKLLSERITSERMESIGLLAGGIAHDFNNILSAILGNVTLAKMNLSKNQSGYSYLNKAEAAIERASSLTRQLLIFSKGGAPVLRVESIGDIIKDNVTFCLAGTKVKPVINIPENLPNVKIDTDQISQVIMNITTNAKESMPLGGNLYIDVTVENVNKDNEIRNLEYGDYIKICFRDEGIGIPESVIDRIFEPFYTTKEKGSGLGLATSWAIIKKHGGTITVESWVGKGTEFRVYLPITEEAKERKDKKEQSIENLSGKVLVMDDQDEVRNFLRDILEIFGLEVETASDGDETIEKFKDAREKGKPFDVVILDLVIPGGLGGKEVLKIIKNIDKNVRSIAISGYSDDPVIAYPEHYGFDYGLAKPLDIKVFNKILSDILST